MFTRLRLQPFQSSGDWQKDGPLLVRWISDYFLSLERPGALSIVDKGDWTPAITFATPGDVSVTCITQFGKWWRIGDTVTLQFRILTSAFTHTTASGALNITGSPFTSNAETSAVNIGSVEWQGITKANYTQVNPRVSENSAVILMRASGSAQSISTVEAADMPTGGTVLFDGNVTFQV